MKVYFDTCTLNRPLDDRSQLRIALESEAVLGILAECEAGTIELVSSGVLRFETEQNPNPQKKAFVTATAVKLLCTELGPVNTARFINQFTIGAGDYTRDRESMLGNPSVAEIIAQIKDRPDIRE